MLATPIIVGFVVFMGYKLWKIWRICRRPKNDLMMHAKDGLPLCAQGAFNARIQRGPSVPRIGRAKKS